MAKKWSKTYWSDLAERVAASALGGALAMVTADSTGVVSGSAKQWWLVVGVPTVVSLLKGLLANVTNPESGPSLLPTPPEPAEEPPARPVKAAREAAARPVKATTRKPKRPLVGPED